jgi:hypothetical protein
MYAPRWEELQDVTDNIDKYQRMKECREVVAWELAGFCESDATCLCTAPGLVYVLNY